MKKIEKGDIIAFLIGAFLFCGMGVVLATVASTEVTYTHNSQTTVKSALDDLYSINASIPIVCYNGTCGKLSYRYWNNNFAGNSGENLFDSTHMPAKNYATRALLEQKYGTRDFKTWPYYIRSVLIDGNVVGHESCFWEANNQKEFCLRPGYWAGTLLTSSANAGTQTKLKLQREMQNALSLESTDISCHSSATATDCSVDGGISANARYEGAVYFYKFMNTTCYVFASGSAYCH